MVSERAKAIRRAMSGQDEEPVELTLGAEGITTHHDEEPAMPETPNVSDDVDAGQVVGRLSRQVAELVKENAVLAVLAETRAQRIGQLEQAVRDTDRGH